MNINKLAMNILIVQNPQVKRTVGEYKREDSEYAVVSFSYVHFQIFGRPVYYTGLTVHSQKCSDPIQFPAGVFSELYQTCCQKLDTDLDQIGSSSDSKRRILLCK